MVRAWFAALSVMMAVTLFGAVFQWWQADARVVAATLPHAAADQAVLRVDMIADRFGHGILISNQGRQWLIDAGGDLDAAAWTSLLRSRQLGLEGLMLTDAGVMSPKRRLTFLARWPVGMVLDARSWETALRPLPLPPSALPARIGYHRGVAGDRFRLGDAVLRLLAPTDPPLQEDGSDSPLAYASGVLTVEWGARRILYAGRLDEAGEERLLRLYSDLRADVLIAGAAANQDSLSPLFLERLAPGLVIVSGCPPHPETLARLEAQGRQIARADQNDRIELILENDWIHVKQHRREQPCES